MSTRAFSGNDARERGGGEGKEGGKRESTVSHLEKHTFASGRLWWVAARRRAKAVESLSCSLKQSSRLRVIFFSRTERSAAPPLSVTLLPLRVRCVMDPLCLRASATRLAPESPRLRHRSSMLL